MKSIYGKTVTVKRHHTGALPDSVHIEIKGDKSSQDALLTKKTARKMAFKLLAAVDEIEN